MTVRDIFPFIREKKKVCVAEVQKALGLPYDEVRQAFFDLAAGGSIAWLDKIYFLYTLGDLPYSYIERDPSVIRSFDEDQCCYQFEKTHKFCNESANILFVLLARLAMTQSELAYFFETDTNFVTRYSGYLLRAGYIAKKGDYFVPKISAERFIAEFGMVSHIDGRRYEGNDDIDLYGTAGLLFAGLFDGKERRDGSAFAKTEADKTGAADSAPEQQESPLAARFRRLKEQQEALRRAREEQAQSSDPDEEDEAEDPLFADEEEDEDVDFDFDDEDEETEDYEDDEETEDDEDDCDSALRISDDYINKLIADLEEANSNDEDSAIGEEETKLNKETEYLLDKSFTAAEIVELEQNENPQIYLLKFLFRHGVITYNGARVALKDIVGNYPPECVGMTRYGWFEGALKAVEEMSEKTYYEVLKKLLK